MSKVTEGYVLFLIAVVAIEMHPTAGFPPIFYTVLAAGAILLAVRSWTLALAVMWRSYKSENGDDGKLQTIMDEKRGRRG